MRMTAGVPNRSATKEMGPTRVVHPRKFILAFSDALCNCEVATKLKCGRILTNQHYVPFQVRGRALSRGCDPKSGRHVQDAAVQSAQQAVSSKAGTFADENDPQSLGQIEPLASEHGTRGARFLPRSLRRDKRRLA